MFNDSSKHRLVVSGTCGCLLKHLEATLCGDKKKKGPIKPSHQRQILRAQQSLLITANSWRSFQRGLYQGQEHLDLNYPWHNVWPFCYHRGGQHLLRRHGPRGHRGYPGQQCKQPTPPPSQLLPHFVVQLQILEPTSNTVVCDEPGEGMVSLGARGWGWGGHHIEDHQLGQASNSRAEPWRADTWFEDNCSQRVRGHWI